MVFGFVQRHGTQWFSGLSSDMVPNGYFGFVQRHSIPNVFKSVQRHTDLAVPNTYYYTQLRYNNTTLVHIHIKRAQAPYRPIPTPPSP